MGLRSDFRIARTSIPPGERKIVQLDAAALYDYTTLKIPVEVLHGKMAGPTLFISAAIHGDEINGTEIIKRLLKRIVLNQLRGTLIVVPIVNVFGFNSRSRYLPDRKDLNRSFPGSKGGSLASQLAYTFMKEVVRKSTHGIDLHSGGAHRSNLPQIRACLEDPETSILAHEFGVPVLLHSQLRDGSLREAARKQNIPMLLFEGGEALRFDERLTKIGVKGCLSVMRKIKMLPPRKGSYRTLKKSRCFVAHESYWIRAPHSGSYSVIRKLGDHVQKDEPLAVISDPFGRNTFMVKALERGIIIGMSSLPLANKGDAMFHIATFSNSQHVRRALELIDGTI